MVARMVRDHKVVGSNPVASTRNREYLQVFPVSVVNRFIRYLMVLLLYALIINKASAKDLLAKVLRKKEAQLRIVRFCYQTKATKQSLRRRGSGP